jgi:hypothetical protein
VARRCRGCGGNGCSRSLQQWQHSSSVQRHLVDAAARRSKVVYMFQEGEKSGHTCDLFRMSEKSGHTCGLFRESGTCDLSPLFERRKTLRAVPACKHRRGERGVLLWHGAWWRLLCVFRWMVKWRGERVRHSCARWSVLRECGCICLNVKHALRGCCAALLLKLCSLIGRCMWYVALDARRTCT